jgi:hypothetical protein
MLLFTSIDRARHLQANGIVLAPYLSFGALCKFWRLIQVLRLI